MGEVQSSRMREIEALFESTSALCTSDRAKPELQAQTDARLPSGK
jgi:hypothetical protein